MGELVKDVNIGLDEVADLIKRDVALTARIIRISNSVVYGGGLRIGAIEDAGCFVADDDLCTGSRAFATVADAGADPLDALARRYLARKPCPANAAA